MIAVLIGKRTQQSFVFLLTALSGAAAALALAQQQPRSASEVMARTEQFFPTGDRNTSMIVLERFSPVEVRMGVDFEYQIRLTNLTRAELRELVVTEQLPATFQVKAAGPRPGTAAGQQLTWRIARLGPGAAETFRVQGSTTRADEMVFCAAVTFGTSLCIPTRVVEPRIALTKSLPAEVILCDPIPMRLVVTNTGTGVARRVMVSDTLPEGLTTGDGRNALMLDAGDLAAGQSREFRVDLRAARTGQFQNTATAREEGGGQASASASVVVRRPILEVVKRGPDSRFIGRPMTFEITVQNTGDAPARDTVLVDMLPPGTEFMGADAGGQLSNGRVTWPLGTLEPRAARTVRVMLKGTGIGLTRNTAVARAYCAEASATVPLEIRGIAAILLEVIDIADPIEVGANETYEIVVTNQGSLADTNIVIQCTLPAEQDFVSADGPTRGSMQGKTITFGPLPSLAPKAKATWKIIVRGTQEGDVRFKVSMTSDQTTTPVEETESTHIY